MSTSASETATASETASASETDASIPVKVFIVPYRDRAANLTEFLHRMLTIILVDETEPYEIYFAHQYDQRPFNRGAMKNVGFLAVKSKYPQYYKNMTFIFHDVDTYPAQKGLIDYTTTAGTVKHYYGFNHALGGIFAIKGDDFEKSKGFPNFWGWGLEDNIIYDRCVAVGLTIDRSIFYTITDHVNIIRPFDGFIRLVSNRDAAIYKYETPDTLRDIKNHTFTFVQNKEFKPVFLININKFECGMTPEDTSFRSYDIRKEKNKIKIYGNFKRKIWSMKSIMKIKNKE